METVGTIKELAAAKIAERWFKSATFMPLVGSPVSCSAYVKTDVEFAPEGFEAPAPEKKTTVIYKKSEIADSLIQEGAYFTVGGIKYTVEGPDENDGEVLGRVIVKQ